MDRDFSLIIGLKGHFEHCSCNWACCWL